MKKLNVLQKTNLVVKTLGGRAKYRKSIKMFNGVGKCYFILPKAKNMTYVYVSKVIHYMMDHGMIDEKDVKVDLDFNGTSKNYMLMLDGNIDYKPLSEEQTDRIKYAIAMLYAYCQYLEPKGYNVWMVLSDISYKVKKGRL